MKTDIKSMTLAEISADFAAESLPSFRAKQVYEWLVRGVSSFDEMSNLPKALRTALSERYNLTFVKIKRKLVSEIDGTVKYLFELCDGECIESVVMSYHHGYSMCLSTQAGCRMGCVFCATGMGGLHRNLTAGEILSQITAAQADLDLRVSSIVLMGMGEPLDNYENTVRFLRLVGDTDGFNLGARHVSLSTCGVVDKIYELAKENFQLTLSVSLHAPNDEIRSKMMPVNNKWGVDELLEACRYYVNRTSRRISFEYTLVDGVNDSKECAAELARRLKGMLCHVNLIPVNAVAGKPFEQSKRAKIDAFQKVLEHQSITATVRRTLGSDINASCGQLRAQTN